MAGPFDNWMQGRPMGGWDQNTGVAGGSFLPGEPDPNGRGGSIQLPPWADPNNPNRTTTQPVPLPPGMGQDWRQLPPWITGGVAPPPGWTPPPYDPKAAITETPPWMRTGAAGSAMGSPLGDQVQAGADMMGGLFGGPQLMRGGGLMGGLARMPRFGSIFGMGGARFQPQQGPGPNYQQGQGWQMPRPSGWGMPGPYGGWGMPR